MEIDFIRYIKPELFILIPILNLIGYFLKKAYKKDSEENIKHIPIILGMISIFLACLWMLGNGYVGDGSDNIFTALFTGIVQGVLCAGAAVYGNQIFKQYTKKDE